MTIRPAAAVGRRSARAILIDDDAQLVLIKRTKADQAPYWTTPGGGIEDHDVSVEAALHRELAGWTRIDMLVRYTRATAAERAADEAARLNLGDLSIRSRSGYDRG